MTKWSVRDEWGKPSVFSVALPPPPKMGADPELTRGHSVTGAQTSFRSSRRT